jgi:predicted anti-sigma-YlaC factor YlaD
MNAEICAKEPQVIQALQTGNWNPSLQEHLSACSVCRESLALAGPLLELAREAETLPNLPSAGFLWFKSRIRRQHLLKEQALRPLRFWARLAYGGTGLALAASLLWRGPQIAGALKSWKPLAASSLADSAGASLSFSVLALCLLGSAFLLTALLTYAAITEK